MADDGDPKRPRRGPVLIETAAAPATPARPDQERTWRGDEPGPDRTARRGARVDFTDEAAPSPADAPPVEDVLPSMPKPSTMELVTRLAARKPSRLTRITFGLATSLLVFFLGVAALDFLGGLMARYPLLGWAGVVLFGAVTLGALAMGVREGRAWSRFGKIDDLRRAGDAALSHGDVAQARRVAGDLDRLYAHRPEMEWGRARLADHAAEATDAHSLLASAEADLMSLLDEAARREVEAAARTVAAATALIPLALVDVAAAFAANLRMIRRIAEIYGGRAGAVGGWKLARIVLTHLVATGAVAGVDDLVQTMAGGGAVSKISRRFGEGVVNGALTARVGIAAIEVCRPMPFIGLPRPRVRDIVTRGLRGLFGRSD